MHKYELTERGKIIICVILVILIFVIPSVIMAVKAWSNTPPPPENPSQTVTPEPDDDVISDGPLPDGSGFDPPTPPETGNGEQGSYDPPDDPPDEHEPEPSEPPEQPEYGPINLNRSEGTMKFKFSPGHQDSLDDDTVSMIGEFITSPKNTSDAQIVAEIPQLSRRYASILISAINDAFAQHGVRQDTLSYVTYPINANESSFEIILSFLSKSNQK